MRIFMWVAIFLIVLAVLVLSSRRKSRSRDERDQKLEPPARWEQISTLLQNNCLPSLHVSLINEKPTSVTESKIGGIPYCPEGVPYPLDRDNEKLTFIAQINLSEIDEIPIALPSTGLLQFFIALDDLMGLTFFESASELHSFIQTNHKKYLVVYHAEPTDPDDTLHEIYNNLDDDESPISGQCKLKFHSTEDIATPEDYRWNNIVKELETFSDEEMEYAYEALCRSRNHKIGGFASFTQQDPRESLVPEENWILLFQLDSESNDHVQVMWGDCGVAQFFIKEEDLKALRFDRVWYNWDCC